MKNGDLDQLIARAEENWTNAVHGHPESCKFGFYCYGDAPGGIAGAAGCFVWFERRDAMLDFVEQTLPYVPPGRSDRDWSEVARQAAAIVSAMRSGGIDDETGLERLNVALRTFSQVEWIGTFDELMNSHERYPTKVRGEFYGDEASSAKIAPIEAEAVESFKDFLAGWGI